LVIVNDIGLFWEGIVNAIDAEIRCVAHCSYPSLKDAKTSQGIVLGPNCPRPQMSYWYERLARGGEVLSTGGSSRPVRIIDVRDLAKFYVDCLEQGNGKTFIPEPGVSTNLFDLLSTCRSVCAGDATFTWVSDQFLTRHGLTPDSDWLPEQATDIPLWISPEQAQAMAGSSSRDNLHAPKASIRPIEVTIQDSFNWYRSQTNIVHFPLELVQHEEEVLHAWHQLSIPYRSETMPAGLD
jgi:2'-hydroxyisoflavone reductase